MFEKFKFGNYRIDDTELANSQCNSKRNNNNSKYAVTVDFLDLKTEKFYLEVNIVH